MSDDPSKNVNPTRHCTCSMPNTARKTANIRKMRDFENWQKRPPSKGYSLCKMVTLGICPTIMQWRHSTRELIVMAGQYCSYLSVEGEAGWSANKKLLTSQSSFTRIQQCVTGFIAFRFYFDEQKNSFIPRLKKPMISIAGDMKRNVLIRIASLNRTAFIIMHHGMCI